MQIKFIVALLLLPTLLFAQTNWISSANVAWYNNIQTEFTITTPQQLAGLALLVNGGNDFSGKTIKLGANIELNDVANWENWADMPPANAWTAIGMSISLYLNDANDRPFNGTFDGNHYVIRGVYASVPNAANGDYLQSGSLFNYVGSAGTVKNIGVTNIYINLSTDTKGPASGLVLRNEGTIINSYSTGSVSGGAGIGGLAGRNVGSIINSYSHANVTANPTHGRYPGQALIGGLVGINGGTIINNYSVGKVIANSGTYAGGLVGENQGTIIRSYHNFDAGGYMNYGAPKYTMEMQSEEFVTTLNNLAGLLSMNAWVYSAGKYPTLSNQVANDLTSSFFDDGDGTIDNPYIINTKKQMEDFSWLVSIGKSFSGERIELGKDIMLNDTTGWQNWENNSPASSWNPIGDSINAFQGTFDGNGFTICGIYINSEKYYQGLFGHVGSDGTIRKLGVIASYINARTSSGGLVGKNYGVINDSYFDGSVNGSTKTLYTATLIDAVGGIAGYNEGAISNSYSRGTVSIEIHTQFVTIYVGGLVGYNNTNGTINNSYSASAVTGSSDDSYIGGLVGSNSGIVSSSYYDTQISGCDDTDKGFGKTTAEMKQKNTFIGWDFLETWNLSDNINKGYPHLLKQSTWEYKADITWYNDSQNEFIITTARQLAGFAKLVNEGENFYEKTIKLGANIALNNTEDLEILKTAPSTYKWRPIGNEDISFNGTFDGDGFVVSGVYINTTNSYQGLFGNIGSSGIVKNIGVIASLIEESDVAGGLAGYNFGTISSSYSTAYVMGGTVGGLVGTNNGTISNSYSAGAVSGYYSAGGLVGINGSSIGVSVNAFINNCYSMASVSAKYKMYYNNGTVGGFVGRVYKGSTIIHNYSAGKIGGGSGSAYYSGGFAGYSENAITFNGNYYDGEAGSPSSTVGIGKYTIDMKLQSTFTDWNFSEIWGIDSRVNNGYPYLLTIKALYPVTVEYGEGSRNYFTGEIVSIIANMQTDKRFKEWRVISGNITLDNETANSTTFIMPSRPVDIQAVFAQLYTVTVEGGEGSSSYIEGETVTLIPDIANEGWEFIGWQVTDGITISDNNTFTMPAANVEITAVFKLQSGYKFSKTGTTYTITKTISGNSIQDVITSIKTDANGEDCTIQFGNGTEVLNIGAASIEFGGTGWGSITLLGKITSSNASSNGVIYISGNVSLDSKADIIKNNGYAINNKGSGTLTISDGTISAASNAVFNFSDGTIDITGGTISATGATGRTINNAAAGTINITGGTISAPENTSAVYNVMGTIFLGSSPSIIGNITRLAPTGTLFVFPDFAPSEKIILDFSRYSEGSVAVTIGSEFIQHFALANGEWQLVKKDLSIILSNKTSPIINNHITLENIPANAKIYNLKGELVYSLPQLKPGIYIIKTNNKSFKITVK